MTPSSTAGCVADRGALAERVSECVEGWFVPSRGQEVSLVDISIRATLGGNQWQEPNEQGPDGGYHGGGSGRLEMGPRRVRLQSEPVTKGEGTSCLDSRGLDATFIFNFCAGLQHLGFQLRREK
jgi:hypothetical protein